MVGAVAAVRRWMTMNHEERLADTELKCQNMMAPLKNIDGVTAEMMDNIIGHQPFGVILKIDPAVAGMTAQQVVDKLKAGDPPIWTRVREGESWIILHAFGLNKGEDRIVGERIAEVLGK
jgi:L-seryl-tRNA(Ser) seleniumtransferase/D-glucosaminate-6-phosphate ammonia-lyase